MSFYSGSIGDTLVPPPVRDYTTPHVTAVPPEIKQHRPTSVQVLDDRETDIFFKFNDTDGYVNFGALQEQTATNTGILPISPIMWSGSHADSAAGDVLFIYGMGKPDTSIG